MASSFTSNLGIEKPGSGEKPGTWGTTANLNYDILDRAIHGVLTIDLTAEGSAYTLTTSQNGTLSNGQYKVLQFINATTGVTVTLSPNSTDKFHVIYNNSGYTLTITQGSGGDATILNGQTAIVYADGAGPTAKVTDVGTTLSAGFTSGTKMLFNQTAAPSGWTKDTSHTDTAIRVTDGTVSSGGTNGFIDRLTNGTPAGTIASSASGSVDSTTLSVNTIPSHDHYAVYSGTNPGLSTVDTTGSVVTGPAAGSPDGQFAYTLQKKGTNKANVGPTSTKGNTGSHTHNLAAMSVTSTFTGSALALNVKYIDVIVATKN